MSSEHEERIRKEITGLTDGSWTPVSSGDLRLLLADLDAAREAITEALVTFVAVGAHQAPNGRPWVQAPGFMEALKKLRAALPPLAKQEARDE